MIMVSNIRCQIQCQKGRSIVAEFPADTGVYDKEGVHLEVSEKRSENGCQCGEIRLSIKNESSRENYNLSMEQPIRVYLQMTEQPEKITAIYMYCEWWSRPAFVERFQEIPSRTQVAFMKYKDRFVCLVPMVGREFKTCLAKGTETELCLEMSAGMGGQKDVEEPLYVLAEGATLTEAVHKVFSWIAEFKGIRTRETRRMPDMFRYLGWCSWDAFYRDITEEKVRKKAGELLDKKVPVKWMLLDDGWFPTKEELLCDFMPDPEKFPDGFKNMIREIKDQNDIRWFGAWHALGGFWGGIDPESRLAQTERSYLYKTMNGKLIPSPLTGEGFYRDWYEKLHDEGIDFTKVDGQSSLSCYVENSLPVGLAAKGIHQALEGAAMYMDGAIINCMGLAMENILSRPTSGVTRNSDDFFPDRKGSFAEHILQNAFNAVYQDELYYCDWDMFWTKHEDAIKHSLLRAISGGPVYVSDKIGDTNAEVLRPMTYKNGEILMMDHSAKPTEDCMFSNPMETGVLKLQNTASWGADRKGGGIAVYNLTDCEQPFTLKPADIPELELADSYWLYDYFKKRVFLINRQDQYDGMVEKDGFGWFVLLPKEKNGSCLGLLDKYVGFTAVESIYENDNTDIIVVRESGTIGYISDREPQKVMVHSEDVTDQIKKTGLLYEIPITQEDSKAVISIVWN